MSEPLDMLWALSLPKWRTTKNDKFLTWKLPNESGELQFRDMKMQPSLERALRHKEILKA
jgi:hypothetical protein